MSTLGACFGFCSGSTGCIFLIPLTRLECQHCFRSEIHAQPGRSVTSDIQLFPNGNIAGKESRERKRCDLQELSRYSELRRSCNRSSISLRTVEDMESIECYQMSEISPESYKWPGHERVPPQFIKSHMGLLGPDTGDQFGRLLRRKGIHGNN